MNRHKYTGWTVDDPTPRHIVGGPLTGWAYTDAIRQYKCPKCGSDPGYYCESKSGRKASVPHQERVGLLTTVQWDNCSVSSSLSVGG